MADSPINPDEHDQRRSRTVNSQRTSLRFNVLSKRPQSNRESNQGARPTDTEGTRRRQQPSSTRVEGLYIISVAARILDMHPQTLRKYERIGLLSPSRTVGMLRLYSEEDVAHLRLIKHLIGDLGLNLAGVHLALKMFNLLIRARSHMDVLNNEDLRRFLEASLEEMMDLLHSKKPYIQSGGPD